MDSQLAVALYERNVLCREAEIDATHFVHDLSGSTRVQVRDTFTIESSTVKEGKVWVQAHRNSDGRKVILSDNSILLIDGMDPPRLARAYNLKPDGSKARVGKKRGRKPKRRAA